MAKRAGGGKRKGAGVGETGHERGRSGGLRDPDRTPEEEQTHFDHRRIERASSRSNRLLRSREWGSLEEANAIVREWLDAGAPEPDVELTPLERAQDIMYDAFETTGRKRVKLARRALEVSPDCADAYVVLAEETARTNEQARDLYTEGVAAGERAIGPEAFEEGEGYFWGVLETRPYMRARTGLAGALAGLGDVDGAVREYRGLLELNPNDNQGIRILLSSLLAEEGRDDELEELLDSYEDEASCNWPYSRALLAFRRGGRTPEAEALMDAAIEANPFVPFIVLRFMETPDPPPYVSLGGPDEAVSYAVDNALAWWRTEGAVVWLTERALNLQDILQEDT